MATGSDSPVREPLAKTVAMSLGDYGALQMRVPGWMESVTPATDREPPAIRFHEVAGGPVRVLVSATPAPGDSGPGPRELWPQLQAMFEQMRGQVVETAPAPHVLETAEGIGVFFSVTDRAPKEGEFLYMTTGLAVTGRLLVYFTILTNADEPVFFTQALAAIRSAVHLRESRPAASAPSAPPDADPTVAFLATDLNSEAALYIEQHPELLEDLSLLALRKVAREAADPRLAARASAAVCALTPARTIGIRAAVWAPGEILAGPSLVCAALRDSLFVEGPDRVEKVVRAFTTVLQSAGEARSRPWAILHVALAGVLASAAGAHAELGEAIIEHLEIARAACTAASDGFLRAAISLQLSEAYRNRAAGDRAQNADAARDYAQSAVDSLAGSGLTADWITAKVRLANAYGARISGFRADNLELAIQCLETVLPLCADTAAENWASIRNNLGNLYQVRMAGDRLTNVRKAVAYLEEALQHRDAASAIWGKLQLNLGNACMYLSAGDIEANDKAIACFERAAGVFQSDPVEWARIQHNLGIAWRDREMGEAAENAATALECFRKALGVLTLQFPRDHRMSQAALGRLHLAAGRWEEAAAALGAAEAADDLLVGQAVTLAGSQTEFREVGWMYSDLAYCLLRRGQPAEALLKFEKGKGRLLAKVRPGQTPMAPIEELLATIPADGAAVAPVITRAGTAVFVLKAGARAVGADDLVWIDNFTAGNLQRILAGTRRTGQPDGWLPAYFQHKNERKNWNRVLLSTGATLWRELLAPINARLTALGVPREAPLVLLPPPGMSVLALHAAWREEGGRRIYLAEEYAIAYAPSLTLLASLTAAMHARPPVPAGAGKTILIAANPTGDLPFAAIEGKAVAAACDPRQTELLTGADASWTAVSHGYERRVYLHFACHGMYDLTYPERSYLALAVPPNAYQGATGNLRLMELFGGWETRAARLAVLSGCETAISDVLDAPAEYLGLASGWLRSGVLGVIGSLWVVDDLAAMLLMERFYRLHLRRGDEPAETPPPLPAHAALRAAQLWLKDLSNAQLGVRLTDLEALPGLSDDERQRIAECRQEYSGQPPDARPFADPCWWAAVTYAGVCGAPTA